MALVAVLHGLTKLNLILVYIFIGTVTVIRLATTRSHGDERRYRW